MKQSDIHACTLFHVIKRLDSEIINYTKTIISI